MELPESLERMLETARKGPRPFADLAARAELIYEEPFVITPEDVVEAIESGGEAGPARTVLRNFLAKWDFESAPDWGDSTTRGSIERRHLTYEMLTFDETAWLQLDAWIPPFAPEPPVVIQAEGWDRWYSPERKVGRTFYWTALAGHLESQSGWAPASILSLDQSSDAVVERLSDPLRTEAYQSKGLVVGFVQSGKTANITAVAAKAVDAGYRLVIVLAGSLNLLRNQTQRRLDRELVGRPLLEDEYDNDSDLENFLAHPDRPSVLGAFDWVRLTGRDREYTALRGGAIESLRFVKANPSLPFNHPDNLHVAPAKLLIVKKQANVLDRLRKDLARIDDDGTLASVPTLVIDDESDQASVNTRRPKDDDEAIERTRINAAIVALLKELPRAQYVGYTATPFANVFVDPSDAADLFPRDFIVSLPRPEGYLGASDFHDLDGEPDGAQENPFLSNERAFVREIDGADNDQTALTSAIDSFLLAGALKLYRASVDSSLAFRHHTMMVHTSPRTADHKEQLSLVEKQLIDGGYTTGAAAARLEELFESDFKAVALTRAPELPLPDRFDDLREHLGEVLARLHHGGNPVLLVNSTQDADQLAFDTEPVWKIIVGGAKLSRGFTIEGLTTTYFRRKSQSADTLMQMGRWCGFRRGYADLVRLFIGRSESHGRGVIDVYEAFEAVCRDEQAFREELHRYALPADGQPPITPMQIPPLVSSHLQWVRPTSRNKMFNARITYRNFGDRWSEHRRVAQKQTERDRNAGLIRDLLEMHGVSQLDWVIGGRTATGFGTVVPNEAMVDLLRAYEWANGEPDLAEELEFLAGRYGDPAIDDWLVMLPQLKASTVPWTWPVGGFDATVHQRTYYRGERPLLNALVGKEDRAVAETITGKRETGASDRGDALRLRQNRRAVALVYPIADEVSQPGDKEPVVGLQALFPPNGIERRIAFAVQSPSQSDEPVVDLPATP
ncbi:MAG: Z1 domain-containing protein [Solirubrobacterales bacterium]